MKIFSSIQTKNIDKHTINFEPISSINLMERASIECVNWICRNYNSDHKVKVFAGCGNNGGDGLAIARLLLDCNFQVEIFLIKFTDNISEDAQINLLRLKKTHDGNIHEITKHNQYPTISPNDLIIDALVGSGLSRPLTGLLQETVTFLNQQKAHKISIDIPSGLPCEGIASENNAFKAQHTLTFEYPFLSFYFPENSPFIGKYHILDIKLSIPESEKSNITVSEYTDIKLKTRDEFSHKGTFGHALIMAGSKGMAGAAVLASKACLKSGCGLVTSYGPSVLANIIHTSFPEAIVISDPDPDHLSKLPNLNKYNALAIGPGLGTHEEIENILHQIFQHTNIPLVIDADALNAIAKKPKLLEEIPKNTIITPHPGEFDRLFGSSENTFERYKKQVLKAQELNIIIILKGRYTSIALPNGHSWFNTTGNNGMASGGSGDVLTGILASLLAQGYSPEKAAITGVFLHGLAGDIAVESIEPESLIASNIIDNISNAIKRIRLNTN
jgi:hydroxyethylthiazole kinase-like uncharacterized protein yjeF